MLESSIISLPMRIWISHSRDAASLAHRLAEALNSSGYDVSAGLEDIQPGESIAKCIVEAIKQADVVIALLSANSARSEWIASEIGLAVQERRRIIPVLADHNAEIPFFLRDLHYSDFSDESRFDRLFGELLAALEGTNSAGPTSHAARVRVLQGERVALEIDKTKFEANTTLTLRQLTGAISGSTRELLLFLAGLALFAAVVDRDLTEHLYFFAAAAALKVLSSLLSNWIALKRGGL